MKQMHISHWPSAGLLAGLSAGLLAGLCTGLSRRAGGAELAVGAALRSCAVRRDDCGARSGVAAHPLEEAPRRRIVDSALRILITDCTT